MTTATYYVIRPTRFNRKKVGVGEALSLTESQARPLRHGGFVTHDKTIADRYLASVKEKKPPTKKTNNALVSKKASR